MDPTLSLEQRHSKGMAHHFLSLLFGLAAIGACADPAAPAGAAPMRTIEIEVQPEVRSNLTARLESYAQQNGFRFGSRSRHDPELGESVMFELRRQDILVLGANTIIDPPPDARGRGTVFSATRFEVSFYPVGQAASDAQHRELIDDVVEILRETEGVEVQSAAP